MGDGLGHPKDNGTPEVNKGSQGPPTPGVHGYLFRRGRPPIGVGRVVRGDGCQTLGLHDRDESALRISVGTVRQVRSPERLWTNRITLQGVLVWTIFLSSLHQINPQLSFRSFLTLHSGPSNGDTQQLELGRGQEVQ